jgi:hypothetical protein
MPGQRAGPREVQSLSTDGQRTLNTLNNAVRNIERDPSQVIFGGKGDRGRGGPEPARKRDRTCPDNARARARVQCPR